MATLELRRLNKTHDDGTTAVDDLDLRVADGELFVLIGPSGCGKTTVLRAVAGLDEVTHGDVLIDGDPVTTSPPTPAMWRWCSRTMCCSRTSRSATTSPSR